MRAHAVLKKAVTETANVVRGVKPDQFGWPTPCRDWDVRALTNHLLQVVRALDLAGRREPVPGDLWGRDLMAEGWTDSFDDDAGTATDAWAELAAWEGTVTLGDMRLPTRMVATMLVSDLAIHGWDLARATGQSYRCDDDVAEATKQFMTDTGEQGRQMRIFAAPLPVADGAPAFARALALSGRDPQWSRPTEASLY